eukprot:294098-Rhodomonas_salina.1
MELSTSLSSGQWHDSGDKTETELCTGLCILFSGSHWWSGRASTMVGLLGTLDERLWVAPRPSPQLMDRTDSMYRAGGAAPTLALGRTGTAGSDSGSVCCSLPPAGCTLTAEGQSTKQYPPPLARCRHGRGFPQRTGGAQNQCRS